MTKGDRLRVAAMFAADAELQSTSNGAAALDGHRALLLGGLTAADASSDSLIVARASGARLLGRLPSARHDTSAVKIGRFVYLFGGGTATAQLGDIIQVDPPQAYGIVQYARTIAMLEARGWPRTAHFPHGGNQMSLAIAAGLGLGGAESYPGVFGDFGGFADDARLEGGDLSLSDRPGIGFEGQSNLYRIMRQLLG